MSHDDHLFRSPSRAIVFLPMRLILCLTAGGLKYALSLSLSSGTVDLSKLTPPFICPQMPRHARSPSKSKTKKADKIDKYQIQTDVTGRSDTALGSDLICKMYLPLNGLEDSPHPHTSPSRADIRFGIIPFSTGSHSLLQQRVRNLGHLWPCKR